MYLGNEVDIPIGDKKKPYKIYVIKIKLWTHFYRVFMLKRLVGMWSILILVYLILIDAS